MPDSKPVYLDHAATTPVDPRVLQAMLPFFRERYGNPSSLHRYGQQAEAAVERARKAVAAVLACRPAEVLFTSCATESDNLALRGAAWAARSQRGARRIITTPVEHHAVLHTAMQLAADFDFELDLLPVDEYGMVAPSTLASRLDQDVALVSIIYANNEIGTINPIPELAALCRQRAIPFHTDAVQAAGQLTLNVDELQVDMLSLGAHKFYGPKGIGVLYVREGTPLQPAQTGGGQEFGLRAGTHNVPLIVGLAEALRLAADERDRHVAHYADLRDAIVSGVIEHIPQVRLTGHPEKRMANHASFVMRGVDGNHLLAALDAAGFACSSGSACKTGNPEPSDVLLTLGISHEWALGSLRVTVGRDTCSADVERFLAVLPDLVQRIRSLGRQEEV